MKKLIITAALLTLFTATLLAHAGEVHTYLGTVKSLAGNEMVITDRDGKEHSVTLTDGTKYWRGSSSASRSDLATGLRVSVEIGVDGKSATTVKLGAKPKP
jgi:hypothetical protein